MSADLRFQTRATSIVETYVRDRWEQDGAPVPVDLHVYVVWFAKTLKNWKALVSTSHPDQRYYEVTHNGETGETYLDAYQKLENVVLPPSPEDPTP